MAFPKHSEFYAVSNYDLIHMDVWGPYIIETHRGSKYFLTLVDNHNRATWVFIMNSMQQVFSVFKEFFAYVVN